MNIVSWVTGVLKLKGDTDGTKIGNSGDALKVAITQGGGSSGSPLCISSKLRYRDMNVGTGGVSRDTSINNSSFVTLFSRTGSGLLASFLLNLEKLDDDWAIKLTVDGEEIFGLNGLLTSELDDSKVYDLDDEEEGNLLGLYMEDKKFVWSSPLNTLLCYNSSVQVSVKRTDNKTKKFRAGLIVLSEEV